MHHINMALKKLEKDVICVFGVAILECMTIMQHMPMGPE